MKFDKYKSCFIVPDESDVIIVMMGSNGQTEANSNEYIGTFGLGPCTAIAASVVDEKGNIYRFCSHIDMGNLVGKKISQHLMDFSSFLHGIPNIKSIDCKLVSSQSFIYDRTPNEEILLTGLKSLQDMYHFDVTMDRSTVVQISPQGKIEGLSETIVNMNRYRQMKRVASANGYKFDYSTKTPCIIDDEDRCYLMDVPFDLEELIKGLRPEDAERIIAGREKSWADSLIDKGGEIEIGMSPLDPDKHAYYLKNYRVVAKNNYDTIPYATRIEDPMSLLYSYGLHTANESLSSDLTPTQEILKKIKLEKAFKRKPE